WMTVRQKGKTVGVPEKVALLIVLCLFAPFSILSFQVATGLKPAFKSAVPIEGPVRIALFTFTFLTGIAAVGDGRLVWTGHVTGARRIARHLWRMCLGLAFAAGSAFTNGFPRLLPKSVHIPIFLLFVPQLIALAVLIFWMVRVRFTGWYKEAMS